MLTFNVQAQNDIYKNVRKYGDYMPNEQPLTMELELKTDGPFELRTVNNIYPEPFSFYINKGSWVLKNGKIIFNLDVKNANQM